MRQHNKRKPKTTKRNRNASGIWSNLKDKVKKRIQLIREGPRKEETARFQNFVSKDGNKKIVDVKIGREPVVSGVQKALNLISLGKYSKMKKKLGYDDVYHNFTIVKTDDGREYRIEKNHVAEAKEITGKKQKGKIYDVPIHNKDMTIGSMLGNARKAKSDFYQYDPASNNCQNFTDDILKSNQLEHGLSHGAKQELKPQDGKQLINSLPGILNKFPKAITDLAGTADRVLHGDGFKRKRRRSRSELRAAGEIKLHKRIKKIMNRKPTKEDKALNKMLLNSSFLCFS